MCVSSSSRIEPTAGEFSSWLSRTSREGTFQDLICIVHCDPLLLPSKHRGFCNLCTTALSNTLELHYNILEEAIPLDFILHITQEWFSQGVWRNYLLMGHEITDVAFLWNHWEAENRSLASGPWKSYKPVGNVSAADLICSWQMFIPQWPLSSQSCNPDKSQLDHCKCASITLTCGGLAFLCQRVLGPSFSM